MRNKLNQEELAVTIQKHITNYCHSLPTLVEKWTSLLIEAERSLQVLVNYCEQINHVEKANVACIREFENIKDMLLFKMFEGIDEELSSIKKIIDQLNLIIQEMKNKLSILEKSTLELDWEEEIPLIQGTAFQPPLSKILQGGYKSFLYFSDAFKTIDKGFKTFNIRNEEAVKDFKNNFKLKVPNTITYYLALIQYVNNKN